MSSPLSLKMHAGLAVIESDTLKEDKYKLPLDLQSFIGDLSQDAEKAIKSYGTTSDRAFLNRINKKANEILQSIFNISFTYRKDGDSEDNRIRKIEDKFYKFDEFYKLVTSLPKSLKHIPFRMQSVNEETILHRVMCQFSYLQINYSFADVWQSHITKNLQMFKNLLYEIPENKRASIIQIKDTNGNTILSNTIHFHHEELREFILKSIKRQDAKECVDNEMKLMARLLTQSFVRAFPNER
ncbi:MAG: hypothetical protein K1000chlam1_00061 [Candidatus Anoxychlamydiales bacterium]|nr:hypothetical protein [Candidatus Anoxychlamydiales bacterium]